MRRRRGGLPRTVFQCNRIRCLIALSIGGERRAATEGFAACAGRSEPCPPATAYRRAVKPAEVRVVIRDGRADWVPLAQMTGQTSRTEWPRVRHASDPRMPYANRRPAESGQYRPVAPGA